MIKLIALVLVLAAANAAAEEAQDRWNLADLYPSVKAWHEDAATLRTELKTIAACRGHLGESAARLKSCLERYAEAAKRLERLDVYASELLAEDTGVPESLELNEQASRLRVEREQASAFMRPELLRLGRARLQQVFAAEAGLRVYTRVRKYPGTLERALDGERLPRAVYDTLIAETNKGLPTLHRYFRLRARLLGIPAGEMRYYDIYPPLVTGSYTYPLDEAKRLVLESARPLGERYVAAMAKGFASRWMDAYPRPHKQSGAHMAGDAYEVHPYVR